MWIGRIGMQAPHIVELEQVLRRPLPRGSLRGLLVGPLRRGQHEVRREPPPFLLGKAEPPALQNVRAVLGVLDDVAVLVHQLEIAVAADVVYHVPCRPRRLRKALKARDRRSATPRAALRPRPSRTRCVGPPDATRASAVAP